MTHLSASSRGYARPCSSFPFLRSLAPALLLAFLATAVSADIVILKDGRKFEGEVKLEGDEYVITTIYGATVRVPRFEVVEIRRTRPPKEVLAEKWKALEDAERKAAERRAIERRTGENGTVDGVNRAREAAERIVAADDWYELGNYAARYRLRAEARQAYRRALEVDANHEGAREALGYYLHDGEWKTAAQLRSMGLVKVGRRWLTREEAAEAGGEEGEAGAGENRLNSEQGGRSPYEPDYITCPKCNGTGVSLWLPCSQCARSIKPGYLNMGDHMELCNRCFGKGRLPGLKCDECNGIGKIDPNRKQVKKEYVPPKGYMICPNCGGSGVDTWLPCSQCGRSVAPGYVNFGDHLELCPRCHGKGKLVGLTCAVCKSKGIVRVPKPRE